MSEFLFGLFAIGHGFRILISDSKLRALSIVPFIVSLGVGSILTVSGLYWLATAISYAALQIGTLLGLLPGGWGLSVLTIALWPIGIVAIGVGVYAIVRLIAAPFYSFLAEAALVKQEVRVDHPFELRKWVALTGRMLLVSLVKALIFAFVGALLFIVSLIPFVNLLATVGFVHMLAFDVSDYSFEAMEWPLKKRFAHFRSNINCYSGFALGLGAAMLIPGLNLVLMPAAVVGASAVLKRTHVGEISSRG